MRAPTQRLTTLRVGTVGWSAMEAVAASHLAQGLASLSFHETSWHLNIDVLSSIASELAKTQPRPVSTSSAAARATAGCSK